MNKIATKLDEAKLLVTWRISETMKNQHERDLETISQFRDNRTFREEVEELLAYRVRKRRDEDTERAHLRCK